MGSLTCMLVVLLAMLVAGLASASSEFAELIADRERWLWVSERLIHWFGVSPLHFGSI